MPSRHILTFLAPAWGHALPYMHLTTRMLAADPDLVVTIVQHNIVVPKMLEELKTCSYDTSRLQIAGVGEKEIQFTPMIVGTMISQLTAGWLEILADAVAEKGNWPKPKTLHMDFFGGGLVVEESRAMIGPEGKILVWFSSSVTSGVDHFSEYNFTKIAQEICADESRRAGRTDDEIRGDVLCAMNGSDKLDGRIIEIIGGLKIYDHEHQAQGAGPPRVLAPILISANKLGRSLFFPVETPNLVEAMIDVLLQLETVIPFVFVLAGKMASLPQETIDRIHASGRGVACSHWVDQKAVLKSGAVGWFLTHGGYNSLTEALSQNIPLIFWPIGAEQAINAAVLSTGPRPIGIELFQIRAGTQLGPSLRPEAPTITGTVEDAKIEFQKTFNDLKGSRGHILTQNAIQVGKLWREERMNGDLEREIARLTRF
ncbi:unnamed protein product [Mycena citricolor]|uniref:Uncharacterized protein n=1 Tax=Mycena citricolor TaxID=2018698 RepID=A0AAD2K709_9AGAR|nr:unnamed protein product [Mycena citricolor]